MEDPFPSVPPPQAGRKFIRLIIPRVGKPERFLSYSPTVEGLHTHWDGATTQPHFSPKERCMWCKEDRPLRWKGYLLGWSWTHRCDAILEIPAASWRRYMIGADPAQTLRGALIVATREGPSSNSSLVLVVHYNQRSDVPLKSRVDVINALCRIWGVQAPGESAPTADTTPEGGSA